MPATMTKPKHKTKHKTKNKPGPKPKAKTAAKVSKTIKRPTGPKGDGRAAPRAPHRPGKAVCVSLPKDVFFAFEKYRTDAKPRLGRSPVICQAVEAFLRKKGLLKTS